MMQGRSTIARSSLVHSVLKYEFNHYSAPTISRNFV